MSIRRSAHLCSVVLCRSSNSATAPGLRSSLRRHSARQKGVGNPFGHQGLNLDPEIGSYQNRARQYAPALKRFVQRDPLVMRSHAGSGYQDGISLYCYGPGAPLWSRDPYGACQIRWRRHELWPLPPKYHIGIDVDSDDDGAPDGTIDYGWEGADEGERRTCCDDNTSQESPPDEWPEPKGPVGEPREYPDGEDNWTPVADCVCTCLSNPTSNYGLYCLLGVPFPLNCSNSSGALHAEVRRCNQCTGGEPGQDPPWIPDWINDEEEPGWDNVPDGTERTCEDIWGR